MPWKRAEPAAVTDAVDGYYGNKVMGRGLKQEGQKQNRGSNDWLYEGSVWWRRQEDTSDKVCTTRGFAALLLSENLLFHQQVPSLC